MTETKNTKNTIKTAGILGLTIGLVSAVGYIALSNKTIRKKTFEIGWDMKDKALDLFEKVKKTSGTVREDVKDTVKETKKLLAEKNATYKHN